MAHTKHHNNKNNEELRLVTPYKRRPQKKWLNEYASASADSGYSYRFSKS